MAEPTPAQEEQAETPQQQPASLAKSTLIVRLAALLFVVAVILGECLVAYRLLSPASPDNTAEASPATAPADAAEEPGNAHAAQAGPEARPTQTTDKGTWIGSPDEGSPGSVVNHVEVDLGQFTVTTYQPAANSTMRIDFHLYGILAEKNREAFDKTMKTVHQRFREQVLMTVRGAEATDLADAGLGLIKRRILEKTNALLGKPLVRAIVISDFSHMEQ